MKKVMIIIIVVIALVLIAGGVLGYLYFTKRPARGFNRNFQLSQSQIDDVTDFFNDDPTTEDINSYCSTNRQNCFYYCRTIDPNDPYCTSLPRPGNRTGNFSGYRQQPPGVPQ